ncbi:hypothetical protein GCM10009540_33340 [Streptomyces turgidiscabies]
MRFELVVEILALGGEGVVQQFPHVVGRGLGGVCAEQCGQAAVVRHVGTVAAGPGTVLHGFAADELRPTGGLRRMTGGRWAEGSLEGAGRPLVARVSLHEARQENGQAE